MKKLISICTKIYHKLVGKDVQRIQQDIIDSFERENVELRNQVESLERSLQIQHNNKLQDQAILQSRIDELSTIRRGLEKDIRELQNRPQQVEYQFVMTQRVYDDLERSLEAPIVTNNTTAQGAGYLTGIQRALAEVRKRYVTNN